MGRKWLWWAVGLVVIAGAVAGGGYWWVKTHSPHPDKAERTSTEVTVQVARPRAGGIQRVSVQPATVEPFEMADLYAKASGYLSEQSVDIGSRVKAGDVLAKLSVPEYEKQVSRDEARVRDAKAKVAQAEARIKAAEAEGRAAESAVLLAKVLVRSKTSYRQYREKQLARIKELVAGKNLEARLEDEQEDFYQSAVEAEGAAKEQVSASQERAAAAKAKVTQAEADRDQANAEVGVAEADLARSKVLLDYTVIKSPYTGVVTRRSFHPGDFIKAADQGGTTPLLTVEYIDTVRVVVQVPDRDAPYLDVGDPAALEVDGPNGTKRVYAGQVARFANAEDPVTRLMRAEIDIPNKDGKLVRGTFGHATITLEPGAPGAVRVPTAAVRRGEKTSVRVVRDGKIHVLSVTIGTDDGTDTEVLTGLTTDDVVVVRASGTVAEGTAVTAGER